MSSFPKIIHYIWINFKNELDLSPIIPKKYLDNIENTKKLNSDYQIKIWNGYDCDQLIKKYFPNKLKFYWDLPYPIQRCDFIRIIILYLYGGIYSDMDRISLKPYDIILDKYNDNDIILSINTYNFVNNDIIFSKPKSDFLLYCINNFKNFNIGIYCLNVFFTTGPCALQYYGWKYKGPDKIIYLKHIFMPCGFCNCDIKNIDDVISLTMMDCSWVGGNTNINNIILFIVCNIHIIIIIFLLFLIIYKYFLPNTNLKNYI
jgi:mannosyltransferase OCH1-like enzyme